jgi:MoxR-like ATPase
MPGLYHHDTLPTTQDDGPAQHAHMISRIRNNLERVIIGKTAAIELLLAAVLSGGHVLLEDIPGVGKTTLAKALARSVGGALRRIQCTPDLLPADIVGVSVFNPQEGAFHFKAGPIFTNILLADELNRTSPRTQSALLEAMGERQVTVDGQSRPLEPLFVVIATQNPIESYGTYPLPEAQLDRFAVQLSLGYPPPEAAKQLLQQSRDTERLEMLEPILGPADLVALQRVAARVDVEDTVADYVLALVEASRSHPAVRLGILPRGALAFLANARARALIAGRHYVTPDDVKTLAVASMAHRLILHTQAEVSGVQKGAIVRDLLAQVQVPR